MSASRPTRRHRPRWMLRVLIYLLVGVLIWLTAVWILQRQVMFPRRLANAPAAIDRPADAEQWWLDTPAGRVEAWLLPGDGVSAEAPGPAVIFAHGNGERIDFWPDTLDRYRALGVTVLLPEFRGYGQSAGTPSAKALLADFARFHDMLAERDDVDADRILFHGRSVGGAVLGTLARDRPPAALVLESTFTSTADVARRYLVPSLLVRDRFDTLTTLRAYDRPVLLLHGRRDTIIAPHHAERLHTAAGNSELVWFDTDHNDMPPVDAYWQAVENFLRQHRLISSEADTDQLGASRAPAR